MIYTYIMHIYIYDIYYIYIYIIYMIYMIANLLKFGRSTTWNRLPFWHRLEKDSGFNQKDVLRLAPRIGHICAKIGIHLKYIHIQCVSFFIYMFFLYHIYNLSHEKQTVVLFVVFQFWKSHRSGSGWGSGLGHGSWMSTRVFLCTGDLLRGFSCG